MRGGGRGLTNFFYANYATLLAFYDTCKLSVGSKAWRRGGADEFLSLSQLKIVVV